MHLGLREGYDAVFMSTVLYLLYQEETDVGNACMMDHLLTNLIIADPRCIPGGIELGKSRLGLVDSSDHESRKWFGTVYVI